MPGDVVEVETSAGDSFPWARHRATCRRNGRRSPVARCRRDRARRRSKGVGRRRRSRRAGARAQRGPGAVNDPAAPRGGGLTVVDLDVTPYPYNAADRTASSNRTGQTTAAAQWRGSTRRHRTLPLFSPPHNNVCPVRETYLSSGLAPRRAGATIQNATMTLRRSPGSTTSRKKRCEAQTSHPPRQEFFSLNEGTQMRVGGADAPPTGGVAARHLPNWQVRPVQSTGGQATGRPPASQHDAVCGGGFTPHPHSMMLCGRPGGGWS